MNYEMIRKNAMAKNAIPEGYGRSVVGGREMITAPTVKAEANPLAQAPLSPSLIDYNNYDENYFNEEDLDDNSNAQGFEESAALQEMGKIPVFDEGGMDVIYERDPSDPNSMYAHPETGEKLFPDMEMQNQAKDEFDKMLNDILIKKRLGK